MLTGELLRGRLWPVCAALILANLSIFAAQPEKPPAAEIRRLFATAITAQKFPGAQVSEILLSEPEISGDVWRYHSEFTVSKSGKSFRCEDWTFIAAKPESAWLVTKIGRGRCND